MIRTGTDNVAYSQTTEPMAVQAATATAPDAGMSRPGMSGSDMANVNVPSVWRTNRTQAAAKVDALSSGGMDNYEIPAFLRKQAD